MGYQVDKIRRPVRTDTRRRDKRVDRATTIARKRARKAKYSN